MGIPLALAAARAGFRVIGADIDAPRVAQINRGESFIKHIPAAAMQQAVGAGRFSATTEMARLAEADAILIAPCSADFIARLVQGRADELLSLLCLARPG